LAVEPKVLLLDEPFGALDTKVRKELRRWLRHLHDTVHITSVFVTHDQEEAMEVSDRVVVMNKGQVEQVGTPDELYEHAVNPFVYQFLGNVNVFKGHLDQNAHFHTNTDNRVASATAYVRPHDLEISRIADGESIAATVLSVLSLGATVRVELLDVQDITLEAELSKESSRTLDLKKGDQVFVKSKQMRVFTESGVVAA
jgi:sulfate transport system ATP-binding protein